MSRFRAVFLGLLILALLVFSLGSGMGWYVGLHNKGLNLQFNPRYIAAAETHMWQSYYKRNDLDLAMTMAGALREQMGASLWTSRQVVEPMAKGAMIFARSRDDYDQNVLPHLEKAYEKLNEACGRKWEPKALARAELDWWVARRTPGQDSPEQVGAKITRLYTLLYGATNPDVQAAGLLRARAAALRDTGGNAADWPAIESLLVQSYSALRRGVES